MRDTTLLIALISLILSAAASVAADPLLVKLSHGTLRGRDNGGFYSYESIPYAEPPLGELRFEAPRPYAREWKETFDATKPPVACVQWDQYVDADDKLRGVEDCLTVNIYKPKNANRSTFPVMVNIHGGAFMFGDTLAHGHKALMASGKVIVAKFTYRLGPLGFIDTGDAVLPGNFGLKDQRLALQWIKQNIAHFGGEPENVLVVGFSSGGAAVQLHLLQEDFHQIAKVAASISGSALAPCAVQPSGRQRAFELGRLMGCGLLSDSLELKRCLRKKDASEIVKAVREFLVFDYVPFTPFGPVVEPEDAQNPYLTQHPLDILKSGKFSQVPWLVSYTEQDGSYNAAALLKRQPNGKELIEELNNRWFDLAPHLFFYRDSMKTIEEMDDFSRDLRQRYLGERSFGVENYQAVQQIFTDVIFRNSSLRSVELHRKFSKSPIYLYVYDIPASQGSGQQLAGRKDIAIGAAHGDDYFLVFDNPVREPLSQEEHIIAKKLINMLEEFVYSNGGSLTYDNCALPNNVGREQLKFVLIKSRSCEIKQLDPNA